MAKWVLLIQFLAVIYGAGHGYSDITSRQAVGLAKESDSSSDNWWNGLVRVLDLGSGTIKRKRVGAWGLFQL